MTCAWPLPDGGHSYLPAHVFMRHAWPLPDGGHPYVPALILMRHPWSSPVGGASLCSIAHPYETCLVPTRRGESLCPGAHSYETGSCLRADCCVPYKSYPQRRWYDYVKCDLVLARVFPPLRSLCSDPLRARDLSSPKIIGLSNQFNGNNAGVWSGIDSK